jgi:hypothetical protein
MLVLEEQVADTFPVSEEILNLARNKVKTSIPIVGSDTDGSDEASRPSEFFKRVDVPRLAVGRHAIAFDKAQKLSGSAAFTSGFVEVPNAWFDTAMSLERAGYLCSALDCLYLNIDTLLRSGQFSTIDDLVRRLEPNKLSIDFMIGILALTRPASEEIPSREQFFERAWNAVESRQRSARELLGGLRRAPKPRQRTSIFSPSANGGNRRHRSLLGWLSRWGSSPST